MLENLNKILDREAIAKEIKDILASFDEKCRNITFKKGIYIYGSPGCGKTQFICKLLQSMDYDIIKYDAGDIRNKALIDTITCNNVSNRNVLSMMCRKKKPIAIVMDEIDEMNNGDKRGITSLIKLIRQKKTKKQKMEHVTLNPIICIGNYYVDKKMKELKKVCHVFELKCPTRTQMTQVLSNILGSRVLNHDIHNTILDFIQGDMRKFIFVENMLKKRPQFLEDRTILENIFQIKTYNDDAKKITHRLINEYIPLEQHNQILNETDRTIISLLYHENIVDILWKNPNVMNTAPLPNSSGDRRSPSELVVQRLSAPLPNSSGDRRSPSELVVQGLSAPLPNSSGCKALSTTTFEHKPEKLDPLTNTTSSSNPITFYNKFLDNLCFADYIDRITFQNQIWIFNEMSSMIKTFYNNWLYHSHFPENKGHFQPDEVRFTKVLTKYSTEYNNQLFLYNMSQELDMDKKDVVAFFQELRLFLGGSCSTAIYEHLDGLFQSTEINRLDIKRMYRFLDKNSETYDFIGGKKAVASSPYDMGEDMDIDEGGSVDIGEED
jgi:Cdc6-like AAA superfamily ATPase